MPADLQSFPEAVDQGLEQGLIVGYRLQYVSIRRHIADGPLAQACAAQSEDVTEERKKIPQVGLIKRREEEKIDCSTESPLKLRGL